MGASIESALGQDHPLVEVIVADDGSTDGSRDIISRYADRVRVFLLEKNMGQAACLSRAWPLARHPIVIFLDSDDLLFPTAAARVAGVFTEKTARVQFCLQTIDAAGKPLDHVAPKFPHSLDTATIRSELLRTGCSPAAQGSGNAYARWMLERIEEDNGFDFPAAHRMAMDAAMEVNAAFYGEVLTLNEPLACYRVHGSSISDQLSVSGQRFIRMVADFDEKLAYMQQRCRALGVGFDAHAARERALQIFEYRLAAAKLDPHKAPDARALDLLWPAMRACATSTYTLRQKLVRGSWSVAVALLPKSAAMHLINWRFVVFRRPQWIETLFRSKRMRGLVAGPTESAPAGG